MKKFTIVMAIIFMTAAAAPASAEMVNIGLGQMEQSEFMALKSLVQGTSTKKAMAITTPLKHSEQYGMMEMLPSEFETLRRVVAGRSDFGHKTSTTIKMAQMVDIGTGEMPLDEFTALKQMVGNGDGFVRHCLCFASVHP